MDLEYGKVTRFEQKLTVIDTPGFSNTKLTDDKIWNKIKNDSGGFSAIFLVLDISRFSDNEEFIENLNQMLPTNFENYLIVMFTHKDRLENTHPKETLSEVIANFGKKSKIFNLLQRAGGRYVDFRHFKIFANNNQLDKQVKLILNMVSKLPKDFFHFNSTIVQVIPETTTRSSFIHFKIDICILPYQFVLFFTLPCFLIFFSFLIAFFHRKSDTKYNSRANTDKQVQTCNNTVD